MFSDQELFIVTSCSFEFLSRSQSSLLENCKEGEHNNLKEETE